MTRELAPIDISHFADLARVVAEVEATGRPRRIRRGDRDVAVLMPARVADRALAARERRFRNMLAVGQRNPEIDGDDLLEELEREDAERRGASIPEDRSLGYPPIVRR